METETTYVYVVENPYGVTTVNRNGNRANQLYRFASHNDANAFVAEDEQHRERITQREATKIINRATKAGHPPNEYPIPFMGQ